MTSKTTIKSPAEMTTVAECDYFWRDTHRTHFNAIRGNKTSAATIAKHQSRMDAISARKVELEAAAQAPVVTLHLTSNQLVSRVDLTLDGALHSASVHGTHHMSRARSMVTEVKTALKVSPTTAVMVLTNHTRMGA